MPLTFRKWSPGQTRVGIWKMEEPDEWFESKLVLSDEEQNDLYGLSPKKRREWLASRWLLHHILDTEKRTFTARDQYGKPFLCGSNLQISLSHSADLVAVIVCPLSCGIDIQHYTPKIEIIADKFMSTENKNCLDHKNMRAHLTLFWSAKESLYKAYGKKELDFRKNILIDKFEFNTEGGTFGGKISKEEFLQTYSIQYMNSSSYALSYCMES